MATRGRKWISIFPDTKKGQASAREVLRSDYKGIRVKNVDEGAVGSTRVSYQVKGIWKSIVPYKGIDYDVLHVQDAGHTQTEGAPEIPQEGLFIAVPENAEVREVRVISKKERDLDGEYYILPSSKPILEGEEPEYIPRKEIYESDELFPGKDIEFLGTRHIASRKVAHILIYLIQYKPKSKRVKALDSLVLEIVYETRPGMDAKVRRKLLRRSPMEQMVLDSESISEGEKLREATEKKTDLDPPGLQDLNNEGEYLIITTNALKNSVARLASTKEIQYKVKTVTIEEIRNEFPVRGLDQSIKDFLLYATENWAIPPEWVVLAGDIDRIATHRDEYETSSQAGRSIASDHFFADLHGDLGPEIAVSRLPVSNANDMDKLCSRAADYDEETITPTMGPQERWRRTILLTAYERSDYKTCKNEISSLIGTRFRKIKKYAGQSSKQEVIDSLNAGVIIANYRGHGSDFNWSASNGLDANDVRNLNNGDKIPLVFSIACWNAHIDMLYKECFAKTWIRNEKAISFLGASRPSWTEPNHDFDRYLFEAIINQRLTKVGDIVNWAKNRLLLNYPGTLARDNIRMYLLLGDPSIDVRPNYAAIHIDLNGQGTLEVSVGPKTIVAEGGTYRFRMGTRATLRAQADAGWRFDHWEDALTGSENPATITMDGSKLVTAHFEKIPVTLNLNIVGGGSISRDPSPPYYQVDNTPVTIKAEDTLGWGFDHWDGDVPDASRESPTITITMDSDKQIEACFEETPVFDLNISMDGEGAINPEPGTHSYNKGSSVLIKADDTVGWRFDHWEGALTGSENTATVIMDSDRLVTAYFQKTFNLSIAVRGTGSTDPKTGTYTFDESTPVSIKAEELTPSWRFVHWYGDVPDASRESPTITITMDSDKQIEACFEPVYIANLNSMEIHEWNCFWLTLMKDSNKMPCIGLGEVKELIRDKGYNGCFHCLHQYDTDARKIKTSASGAGSITPSGTVFVNYGADESFYITPDTGYQIVDVLVDGISVGPVSSYTFTGVVVNHTIRAIFPIKPKAHRIDVQWGSENEGEGGFILPSNEDTIDRSGSYQRSVKHGANITFEIAVEYGYAIVDVEVDGKSVGGNSEYTFWNVVENHSISAIFCRVVMPPGGEWWP